MHRASLALALTFLATTGAQAEAGLLPYEVMGDTIPRPLTTTPADPVRGRAIIVDRQRGLCLLCHTGPFPEERFQGNLAPDLWGAGKRLTEGQLRLRLVDGKRLNPESLMPSYYRTEGLRRVAPNYIGRPLLQAGEIEDVVAFLVTLRDEEERR